MLQNVADGIVTAGETGLIESFNRSAQRLFGYKEYEVIGQPLRLVIAPNADDAASELATTEAVGRRKDGSCFPMEINTSLVNIGERMLTIGCIRDISARNEQVERERERQNALRREALRDRLAFEAAPIGGIITARDGTIERVNQAMCEMTGYTADELIGTPSSELAHPDERQHGAGVIDALLSGRSDTERFDKRYLHAAGGLIEARVALTTIRDEHDEVDAALRPDRGHDRGPADQPGARAGAVRDARPARRGRRVPRRRHRGSTRAASATCRSPSPSTSGCPTPRSS